MARARRTSSTIPFAVEQAQLINPAAFRLSTASAESLKIAGGVLSELGKRELAAKNSLAINASVESRSLAKLEMQEFIKNNPDPDTWEEGLQKILEKQGKIYTQQKFNSKTQKEQEIEQEAFKDALSIKVGIATVTQNIENDITISGKNVIDAVSTDDGTPEAANDIQDAIERLQKAYERKYEPKIAAIHLEETLREAKKAFYIDQSKLDPAGIISKMEKKKKVLGKGGKDKEGLGAKDYDDIIASAYTAQALASRSLDIRQETDRDELGQALHDGTINYTMINSTTLSEKEQESYRVKMNAEAERKAKGIIIKTNHTVKGNLESMAYDISTGAVTMPEFKERLTEERYGNKTINDDVYDELFSLAERKFESYQAGAMKGREVHALGQLVTYPSEVGIAERLAQLTSQFEKDQVTILRQLQFDNLDQYKKALRDWLKINKDANADEIYAEGRRLLTHYRKTPDQLRNQPNAGQAAVAALKKVAAQAEFGLRPSGAKKGKGFLGVLKLKGGGVATEYSVGVKLEANDGKETDIPSLVPTLTQKEIDTMVNDIIPNKKPVPEKILQKAVDHANKRVRQGKSPFLEAGESKPKSVKSLSDVPVPKGKREFINKLRELEAIDPTLSAEYYKKYLDKFW